MVSIEGSIPDFIRTPVWDDLRSTVLDLIDAHSCSRRQDEDNKRHATFDGVDHFLRHQLVHQYPRELIDLALELLIASGDIFYLHRDWGFMWHIVR